VSTGVWFWRYGMVADPFGHDVERGFECGGAALRLGE
jgi:hypothetical protein